MWAHFLTCLPKVILRVDEMLTSKVVLMIFSFFFIHKAPLCEALDIIRYMAILTPKTRMSRTLNLSKQSG